VLREGPIPRTVHGAIEYLLGVVFLGGPILFNFDSDVATGVSIAIGILVLVNTAITAGMPTSLVKQLAMTAHVTVDMVLSIFLIVAPFVLGFASETAPRNFYMILGVALLLMTIGTKFREPSQRPTPP
jgi:uncharacterized membrane protein YoaK (UPF0700 family)